VPSSLFSARVVSGGQRRKDLRAIFMNLLCDMTELSIRMFRSASTGIDRAEYAYAKDLLNVSETTGVFTTPLFVGALRKCRALDLLRRVERASRLGQGPAEDAVFVGVNSGESINQGALGAPRAEETEGSKFYEHSHA
jgi:hypothetical protein